MARRRIGDLLVQLGALKPEQLQAALEASRTRTSRVVTTILELGFAKEEALVEALAQHLGVPGVDFARSVIPTEHLTLIPREVAQIERILPVHVEGGRLLLAMADPQNARVIAEVQLISGLEVLPHVALAGRIDAVVQEAYGLLEKGEKAWVGEAVKDRTKPALALAVGGDSPSQVDDDIDIEIGELDGDDAEEIEVGAVSARTGPRVVLVVDDEEDILTLVGKALESKGYKVEKARRGQEALDRANALLPDMILLDANLPEIHGFDICRKLKSNRRFARTPVMIMTAVYRGWRFAHDLRESFGADDYIEKPFRLDDLLRRVDHHLQKAIGEPARDREAAERHYLDGVKLLDGGKSLDAITALEKAAEADGFSAKIQYQLGRAFQAKGDAYLAISAYERAVDLRPELFPALRSLAALYQQKGFRRKAIEAWERAIPAAPDEATRTKIKHSLLALL